jgi:hypothetical protein
MASRFNTAAKKYIYELKELRDDIVEIAAELKCDWEMAYDLVLLSWIRAISTQNTPPGKLD